MPSATAIATARPLWGGESVALETAMETAARTIEREIEQLLRDLAQIDDCIIQLSNMQDERRENDRAYACLAESPLLARA